MTVSTMAFTGMVFAALGFIAAVAAAINSYNTAVLLAKRADSEEAEGIVTEVETALESDKDSYRRHRRAENYTEAFTGGKLIHVPDQGVTIPPGMQAVFPLDGGEPTLTNIPVITEEFYEPPMVDGMTLKGWMIHLHREDGIFKRVVDKFYERAASNHLVRPYFAGHDLIEIKRKFLATLLIVIDRRVDRATVERLIASHADLGITPEAYDATMKALNRTLTEFGAPVECIDQMLPLLWRLRQGMTGELA